MEEVGRLVRGEAGGTLAGVAVAAGATIDGSRAWPNYPYNPAATVTGGLVLDGAALLGKADGGAYAQLTFQGTQALSGSGAVTLGGSTSNALYARGSGVVTLTVGTGVTIRGGSGTVAGYGSYGATETVTNLGRILAGGNGSLTYSPVLRVDGAAQLSLPSTATLTVPGNLLGTTGNPALFTPSGTVKLTGAGTSASPELLEVMSADLGSGASAFANNFAYGTLVVGSSAFTNTYVKLVDQSDNSAGSAPEALYVNSLVVAAGSTLDLGGFHLYVRNVQLNGTIKGEYAQIPDSGPLSPNTPTPGRVSVAGELDNWTFYGRAGEVVTAVLDPGSGAAGGPISPALGWGQAQLLDSGGHVLATASSTSSGAVLTLPATQLPADGTYTVAVKAGAGHTASVGNYVVAAWDSTPNVRPLSANQTQTGTVATAYATDRWTFAAAANAQVKFDLQAASAGGLRFSLTGPGGYTGFTNAAGGSGLLTLPAAGTYTLTVQGTGGAVGSYAFKMALTDVTPLALGVPYTAPAAATGQARLYRVTVGAANPLAIRVTGGSAQDQNEVYVSLGKSPTRDSYDYRFTGGPGADQTVVLTAAPGTYDILVYNSLAAAGTSYTIRADSAPFLLTGASPGQVGNARDTTLLLTGVFPLATAGGGYTLRTSPTVQFVAADGTVYPAPPLPLAPPPFGTAGGAGGVNADGTMTVSVLPPANTLPAGTYSIRVTDVGGYTQTLTDALSVVQGGVGVLKTNVVVPNPIGFHAAATIYVQYSNVGDAPMPAPLLVLTATQNGVAGALLTLDASKVVSGFWTSATPDGYGQSVQFLAGGAVPGVLQPGESVSVPVYYAGWLHDQWDFSRPPINFSLGVLDGTNAEAIDWPSLKDSLRPASISQAAWDALFPNLTAQLGQTWGSYVQRLDADARYLAGLGEAVTDIGRLFNFEVQQANGFSPLATLASATDAGVAAPGLALGFSRTFAPGVLPRNQFGRFGWGWADSWTTAATTDPDGSVNVLGPNGSLRRFQPDSRDGYFAQAGDHGALAKVAGGGFTLTELNGQVTAYNADGSLNYVKDPNGNRITASYAGAGSPG